MSLIPAFEIGLINAWLFMIVYPLQWLLVLVVPRHVVESTGHPTDLKQTRKDKVLGQLNQILWIAATLYSIFLPLRTGTPWFYVGLAVFICGLIILIAATVSVYRTPAGEPFGGIYRFSRHPMYLSMFFVYIGVSIAAISWLFLLITVITYLLQRHQALQEEAYCLGKFGDVYREYMNRTPRWLGMPKS